MKISNEKRVNKLIVKNKAKTKKRHGYYIKITFMFGDADGYTDELMGPFSENEMESLYDAIETIERCVNAYPSGRCGYDTYNSVEGFEKWFGWDYENTPEQAIDMVYEPNGQGIQATIDRYKVLYYDHGTQYECEVEWVS